MNHLSSNCKAGFCYRDITPEEELRLTGFANPPQRTGTKVRTPLMAQAVYLSDQNDEGALIFAVDLLGFDASWARMIRQTLAAKTGIASERIILNASHTHCGPQVRTDELFGVIEPCDEGYRSWLADVLIELGIEARAHCSPCTAYYSVGTNRRATYRRFWDGNRWINAPSDHHEPERHLPLMELHWGDGRIMAMAVIAGHPTTAADPLYDSHYQGALRKQFRVQHGIDLMILSGSGGDSKMTSPLPDRNAWLSDSEVDIAAIATAIESDLQNARKSLVKMAPWQLRSIGGMAGLPLWKRPMDDISAQEAGNWRHDHIKQAILKDLLEKDRRPMEISMIGWNSQCRWIFLEGEVCGDYGSLLRAVFSEGETAVAAYSQGLLHYIPTEQIALEGGYEGHGSFSYVKPGEELLSCHPSIESEILRCVSGLKSDLENLYQQT